MKSWIAVAFGAAALATASFAAATPAAATPVAAASNVGIYVGPNGLGVNVSSYRNRCRNYWYRRNHPYRCGYGRYYNQRYYPHYYYYNDNHRHRYHNRRHHRHHDHDRRRDRDRWHD